MTRDGLPTVEDFESTPALFASSRAYREEPDAITQGHSTANEQALYDRIAAMAGSLHRGANRSLVIADLCSASGGCASRVLEAAACARLYLVDQELVMLEAARRRTWDAGLVRFDIADAVTWRADEALDVILLNSAYHHIEDSRKTAFLMNAAQLLGPRGRILVGEHFLPPFTPGDLKSYRSAVLQFYEERLRYLAELDTPEEGLRVIRQTGLYCWNREFEFQVSQAIFEHDARKAGLRILHSERVWPTSKGRLPPTSGSFFLALGAEVAAS